MTKLSIQLNKDIARLSTNRIVSIRHRRSTKSSCDPKSKPYNQVKRARGIDFREREGNRNAKHAGVIPTCPENKYQIIEPRTAEEHKNHQTAAKSGNILLSFHSGRWHAGSHPEYG